MPSYNNPLLTAHALTKGRPSGRGNNGHHCGKCGKSHERGNCPTYGKTCDKCKGINHFKAFCCSKVTAKTAQSPHQSKKPQLPQRHSSMGSNSGHGKGASTSQSTSPELLEMERSFNTLLTGTRDKQGHSVTRSQMDNLRDQQQHIAVLKQVAMQPQNQPRPVSVPPATNVPLPLYPRRRPSDMGSRKQVQAENANALHKSSDSGTDRLQDINEEPHRCIGPSRVKELAKFFTPTSDEEDHS